MEKRLQSRAFAARAVLALLTVFAVLLAGTGLAHADELPAPSSNAWANSYVNAGRSGNVSRSALSVDGQGNLERAEYIEGRGIVVEKYSTSGKFLSGKTVETATFQPSDLADASKLLWGGLFCGEKYNFVVTGQENLEENNSLVVLRVTRYTKNWECSSNIEYRNINTYVPFEAGSCAMAEYDGVLVVRTCHTMYQLSDGRRHQAAMLFKIDEASMEGLDSMTGASNIAQSRFGYVSHSFDQKLAVLGGTFYSLDLGDSGPRAAVVKKIGSWGDSSYAIAKSISGKDGDNTTNTTVGGLAASSERGTLLAVGTQRDDDMVNNVWLTVVNAGDMSVKKQIALTALTKGSSSSVASPQIVPVTDDECLVMWCETSGASDSVAYAFVDGEGSVVRGTQEFSGFLSDCQPIVSAGKVYWYATGLYSSPQAPVFFAVDVASRAAVPTGDVNDLSEATVSFAGSLYYDGSAIVPTATVRFGSLALTEGGDYTIAYENNVDAGVARAIVTGAGKYEGQSLVWNFEILPVDLEQSSILYAGSRRYTGAPVRYIYGVSSRYSRTDLKEGVDYTVSYQDNVNAGTASYTIVGDGKNVIGSKSGTFTIEQTELGVGNITIPDATYTGFPVIPELRLNGRVLSEDEYDISCTDNVDSGTASATITAKGNNCTGSFTTTFEISKKNIGGPSITATLPETAVYTGSPIVPDLVVSDTARGTLLSEGTDYTLNAISNTDVGTATVHIYGEGNYTGIKYVGTFQIVLSDEDQGAIDSFAGLVAELPSSVNSDADREAVAKARAAYDALTELQKSFVSTADESALNTAESFAKSYDQTKAKEEQGKTEQGEQTDTETEGKTDAQTGEQSGAEIGQEAGNEEQTGRGTETGQEADTDTKTDTDTRAETETGIEANTGSDNQTGTQTETDNEGQTGQGAETDEGNEQGQDTEDVEIDNGTHKIASSPSAKAVTALTVNAKTVKASTLAKAAKKAGADLSKVKTLTLGKKVKTVKKGALKSLASCKTIVVKTKKLTKKSIKGALKGSKVKTVKVKVGSKKQNKAYAKKYKKLFTKKVCGKKVAVKAA